MPHAYRIYRIYRIYRKHWAGLGSVRENETYVKYQNRPMYDVKRDLQRPIHHIKRV